MEKKIIIKISTLIFFAVIINLTAAYSPAVITTAELDNFMLRISSRYGIKLPDTYYAKPMHAKEITDFLNICDSLSKQYSFSKKEQYLVKKLKHKYSGKMHLLGFDGKKIETSNYVNIDLLGDFNFYNPIIENSPKSDVAARMKGILGPKFSGNIRQISYYTEMQIWTEVMSDSTFGSCNYQPYNGLNYNLYDRASKSNVRSSDRFRAGISYDGKLIDIETALDYLRVGPVVYNPLTLNMNYAPATYFRALLDMKVFNYTHVFGLLRSQTDKPKYFYFHRLDFDLFKNRVVFGINEIIIGGSTADLAQSDPLKESYYGVERTWEWAYMIPFVPYALAEHYVGNRDNNAISLDLDIMLLKNFRFYGEFFIDDMLSPFKIFSNDFGNKWAGVIGGQFFGGNKILQDLTVTAEYSRIEPWVYTHTYGGSHRYTNFGRSIGSYMGPNSELFVLAADYGISEKNVVGFKFENQRYNHNVRGGKIEDVWLDSTNGGSDIKIKDFLGDDYTHDLHFGLTWSFSTFQRFHYDSELYIESLNGLGFKINGGFSW